MLGLADLDGSARRIMRVNQPVKLAVLNGLRWNHVKVAWMSDEQENGQYREVKRERDVMVGSHQQFFVCSSDRTVTETTGVCVACSM